MNCFTCPKPLTLAVALAGITSPLHAEPFVIDSKKIDLVRPPSQVLFVPFVKQSPQLDGKLDEPLWKEAAVVKKWIDPASSLETPLAAEVRMASDQTNLFVSFNVKADMSKVKFKQPKEGDEFDDFNSIELFFDPSARGKHKFQIAANPLGLRYDSYNGERKWEGQWTAKGDVRSDGWSIEFVIPMTDLKREPLSLGYRYEGNFCYNDSEGSHFSWTGKWGEPGKDYGDLYFGKLYAPNDDKRCHAEPNPCVPRCAPAPESADGH